ncbi:unnamed protein product [Protopolystoma xenopodis]|uniref:Uncharacterized protein n=1 Tax=Protopolystoma xenopodis TaxID=117903 RepID=A0A448XKI9_9PLAT|nr:unnamed protein product [Protopolystoma xenopodis]
MWYLAVACSHQSALLRPSCLSLFPSRYTSNAPDGTRSPQGHLLTVTGQSDFAYHRLQAPTSLETGQVESRLSESTLHLLDADWVEPRSQGRAVGLTVDSPPWHPMSPVPPKGGLGKKSRLLVHPPPNGCEFCLSTSSAFLGLLYGDNLFYLHFG